MKTSPIILVMQKKISRKVFVLYSNKMGTLNFFLHNYYTLFKKFPISFLRKKKNQFHAFVMLEIFI